MRSDTHARACEQMEYRIRYVPNDQCGLGEACCWMSFDKVERAWLRVTSFSRVGLEILAGLSMMRACSA